jgi:hypothetical protein
MVNRREVDKAVFCFDRAERCVAGAALLAGRSFRIAIGTSFAGRFLRCVADAASVAGRSFLCDSRSSSPMNVFLLALFLADLSSGSPRDTDDFELDATSFVRTRCVVLLCLIPKGPALGPDGSTIRVMRGVADAAMSVESAHCRWSVIFPVTKLISHVTDVCPMTRVRVNPDAKRPNQQVTLLRSLPRAFPPRNRRPFQSLS